ncbi:MAG: cytochrome C [bacterium]
MEHLLAIISKADNIPIVGMVFIMPFFTWLAFREAFRNDRRITAGEFDLMREEGRDRVYTWPYLTRNEFLAAIFVMALLTVWSIVIDAPLEQPANPTKTPNPSKAPWYFLGLQEMLVYFDPWIAGVVLPTLIIVGLMAIPYLDKNPKGNGYYTWDERKFSITIFLFGFFVLWLSLIMVGTFLRGPGWNFFMPWETWDIHKVVSMTNVDLHQKFGIRSPLAAFFFGGFLITAYYSIAVIYYFWKKNTDFIKTLGVARYSILAFLFLTMMALPIKMILRWSMNIKYIWVTPWFNI